MSKNDKTIEQNIQELEQMIAWFDSEDFRLEDAIGHYQEAEKLAGKIEQDLTNLKNKITVITKES